MTGTAAASEVGVGDSAATSTAPAKEATKLGSGEIEIKGNGGIAVAGIGGVVIGKLVLYNSDIFSIQKKGQNVTAALTPILVVTPTSNQTPEKGLELLHRHFGWAGTQTDHPDLHWFDGRETGLKIEDVRQIAELLTFQPVGSATYIVVLALEKASLPAQQALLKMLEEPPTFGRWLLLVSSLEQTLPTIQSRCQVIEDRTSDNQLTPELSAELATLYQKIQTGSVGEAIALSDTYSDRATTLVFLQNLIRYLYQQPPTTTTVQHLQTLIQTTTWVTANANLKLALGECFLALRQP